MRHDPAFLEAIQAALDDDAPRLVYSDWLLEKGARYGAFIAAGCALAAAERDTTKYGIFTDLRFPPREIPAVVELRGRMNKIWRKNRKDWEPTDLPVNEIRWRRGFIDHLSLDAPQMGLPLTGVTAAVTSLTVNCQDGDVARVLEAPMLQQIRHLEIRLDVNAKPAPVWPEPLERAAVTAVRIVRPHLLGGPQLRAVQELSLGGAYITGAVAAAALSALPYRAVRLNVSHVQLGLEGWKTLAENGWLENLEVLNARDTALTDAGVRLLLDHLGPGIRALDLSGNQLSQRSVDALAALTYLEHLDLRGSIVSSPA